MKVTIPDEVMVEIINRALDRARRREYVICFQSMAGVFGDAKKTKEFCSKKADRVSVFTAEDFEVEARKWIQERRAWAYKVSSLRRKLRRWAREGVVVEYVKAGVYRVIGGG